MICLFCDDRIEVKENPQLGEWRYIHTSGAILDHPATLKPEFMTEAAAKERAWFNAWGFRKTTRSISEEMTARTWFNRGWDERGKIDGID